MKKPQTMFRGMLTFYGFFLEKIEECEVIARKSGWNEKTTGFYIKLVEEKIVPHIPEHDYRPIWDLMEKDFQQAISVVKSQGKGKPGEKQEPYSQSTLEKLEFLIRAVVTVAVRHGLSAGFSSKEEKEKAGKAQQTRRKLVPKSLTPALEKAALAYIRKNMFGDGSVAALLLMFSLGLRNAEGCGVNFSHIRQMKSHPENSYLLVPQTTQIDSNESQIGGKSKNAGRAIPIPNPVAAWLRELYEQRKTALQAEGLPEEALAELPIACKGSLYQTRCRADDISAAGRKMFIAIGMRQETLCAVAEAVYRERAEAVETKDRWEDLEKDPTSYLLRRNFATQMMILGMEEEEMEYLIGHEIEDSHIQRGFYTDEKLLMRLKRKLDRRGVFLAEDGGGAMVLEPGKTRVLDNVNSQTICLRPGTSAKHIRVSVTANEPGDAVVINGSDSEELLPGKGEVLTHCIPAPESYPRSINVLTHNHREYS